MDNLNIDAQVSRSDPNSPKILSSCMNCYVSIGNLHKKRRIMVPIAKPAIITIILLNSIDSWNSFLWPMLVTNEPKMRTVTVGLTSFVQAAGIRYERLMAAAFVVVIPMMILFFFARKYIITAVAQGGIKG